MTRYRLDSQFHCSYLDSRGVPGKPREMISLSFPVHDFRWRHFRWRHFRWCNFRWCNFRWRHDPHRSPTNARWMVLLYYSHDKFLFRKKSLRAGTFQNLNFSSHIIQFFSRHFEICTIKWINIKKKWLNNLN